MITVFATSRFGSPIATQNSVAAGLLKRFASHACLASVFVHRALWMHNLTLSEAPGVKEHCQIAGLLTASVMRTRFYWLSQDRQSAGSSQCGIYSQELHGFTNDNSS